MTAGAAATTLRVYVAAIAALPVLQLGLLHMRPIQFWLKQRVSIRGLASRTPPRNGDSDLCISPGPLEGPLLAKARRDPRDGAQKEGCHDRRFQQGLGSAVRGQTDLRPVFPKRSQACTSTAWKCTQCVRPVNSSCQTFRDTMC